MVENLKYVLESYEEIVFSWRIDYFFPVLNILNTLLKNLVKSVNYGTWLDASWVFLDWCFGLMHIFLFLVTPGMFGLNPTKVSEPWRVTEHLGCLYAILKMKIILVGFPGDHMCKSFHGLGFSRKIRLLFHLPILVSNEQFPLQTFSCSCFGLVCRGTSCVRGLIVSSRPVFWSLLSAYSV